MHQIASQRIFIAKYFRIPPRAPAPQPPPPPPPPPQTTINPTVDRTLLGGIRQLVNTPG